MNPEFEKLQIEIEERAVKTKQDILLIGENNLIGEVVTLHYYSTHDLNIYGTIVKLKKSFQGPGRRNLKLTGFRVEYNTLGKGKTKFSNPTLGRVTMGMFHHPQPPTKKQWTKVFQWKIYADKRSEITKCLIVLNQKMCRDGGLFHLISTYF